MTTQAWSSGNANTSTAEFRAWGSEFSAKLAAVGLIQTADTGQINWSTVTLPGANSFAGYEIWRFNDAMQGTAPIFLGVNYGTGNGGGGPRISIEVGTGSNGSGTLTGIGSGTILVANQQRSVAGSATASNSYMCCTEGFFGFAWKVSSPAAGWFVINRTCDASGTPDGGGYLALGYGAYFGTAAGLFTVRMVRFTATAAVRYSAAYSETPWYVSMSPGFISPTTLENGDRQAYIVWGSFPDNRPLPGLCVVANSEISAYTTFSTAMVGSTSRTFIGTEITNNALVGSTSFRFAMLWE